MIEEQARNAQSFRDPDAILTISQGRVLRRVRRPAADDLLEFLKTRTAQTLTNDGKAIASTVLRAEADAVELEHPRVDFASYCWEWPASALADAAELTLDVAEAALAAGFTIKDATPQNVLFQHGRPVFIDIGSFERLPERAMVWPANAQFVRTFILPLIAHRRLGWPLRLMLGRRDGYQIEELYPHLSIMDAFSPAVLSNVFIPKWVDKAAKNVSSDKLLHMQARDRATRDALLRRRFRVLRQSIARLRGGIQQTNWTGYETMSHYAKADQEAKARFVQESCDQLRPRQVLDLGANTGFYSRLAARAGASVVSVEADAATADIAYQRARQESVDVQTLVMNAAHPTPAAGWDNREMLSFTERAAGNFDMVLMLAVIHHLLLTEHVPLPMVLDYVARVTRRAVVLEWVPQEDGMFRELVRGRGEIFAHLTIEHARNEVQRRFAITREMKLPNGRLLWLLEKS